MVTMPVDKGFVVTSPMGPRWGQYHFGVDYGVAGGSGGKPIYAIKDGTVIQAGAASGFGQWIRIDHPASVGAMNPFMDISSRRCVPASRCVRGSGLGTSTLIQPLTAV